MYSFTGVFCRTEKKEAEKILIIIYDDLQSILVVLDLIMIMILIIISDLI